MIQNLLPLLPRRISLPLVLGISVAGGALWLAGARFSRSLLALAGTVGGGVVGYQTPHWFGWNVDPWTVAVGVALVLGIVGFVAHRWVAAVGLGVVLAGWSALAAITCTGPDEEKHSSSGFLPGIFSHSNSSESLSFGPQQSSLILLASLMAGLVVGLAVGFTCRKLGVVLFWSLLGSAAALMALLGAARPDYLTFIPRQAWEQALFVIVTVIVGAAVQWRLTFVHSSPKPAKSD